MKKNKVFYVLPATAFIITTVIITVFSVAIANDSVFLPIVSTFSQNEQRSTTSVNASIDLEKEQNRQMSNFGIPFVPTATTDPATRTPTPFPQTPDPNVTPFIASNPIIDPPVEADLSPELAREEKFDVIIQYPDGKRSRILAGGPDGFEKVKAYLATIKEEVMLVSTVPPASLMGHQPPRPPTPTLVPPTAVPPPDDGRYLPTPLCPDDYQTATLPKGGCLFEDSIQLPLCNETTARICRQMEQKMCDGPFPLPAHATPVSTRPAEPFPCYIMIVKIDNSPILTATGTMTHTGSIILRE